MAVQEGKKWDIKLLYQSGNSWQKDKQVHVSRLNFNSLSEFGQSSRGNTYYHFIPFRKEYYLHNFLQEQEIFDEVANRFGDGKAGDFLRCVTNMLSSQACCFNFFAPLKNHRLAFASRLFSKLMDKEVTVKHIVLEFTPNNHKDLHGFDWLCDESIGDQGEIIGTDADVAVFYDCSGKRGLFLCEFKFIEQEFSKCGSYHGSKKGELKPICDNVGFYKELISPVIEGKSNETRCGYLKYNNWQLTNQSKIFDVQKVVDSNGCPFRNSTQQIWRNLLLVEKIATSRGLDEFYFGVVSPHQNTYLWNNHGENVENSILGLLTDYGKSIFKKIDLEFDLVAPLEEFTDDDYWCRNWLHNFRLKYLAGVEA